MRALAVEENTRLVNAYAELIATRLELIALQNGVTTADVPLDALDLETLLTINHPNAITTILLVDSDGTLLFSRGATPEHHETGHYHGVAPVLAGESGVMFTADSMMGDVVAYAPVPNTRWGLVLSEPWHTLTTPLLQFEQAMPLILFTAIACSVLTLFFGLRDVVQPLRDLGARAVRIGQGEFNAVADKIGGVQEIDDLRRALHDMARRVEQSQAALHDYAGAVTRAQEDERARLARDLHDETVQTLIALSHKTQMAQRSLSRDSDQTAERLAELREMVSQAILEVRRFSQALHPHHLEELGLVAALETLARGANAEFTVRGEANRLPPAQELVLYRLAQEAINNAVRHAQASTIRADLTFDSDRVTLTVRDDGRGFNVPVHFNELTRTGHFGLMGMRERAQLAGGDLTIRAKEGRGTEIIFTLPIGVSQPMIAQPA